METVGGYRLVRRLGSGQRAEIHLGHAGTREPPEMNRIAAIKLYRATTPDAEIDTEIEALSRSSSPHLLELKDLSIDEHGRPCLILPRLGSGSVGRLLAVRTSIAAGEAVTMLVPLIESVAELHRVGIAHGAIATGSVLFDTRGAPVLARFGRAKIVGDQPTRSDSPSLTLAQLEASSDVRGDLRDLAELSRVVLDRILPHDTSSVLSELNRMLEAMIEGGVPDFDAIVEMLFELEPAQPVRFADAPPKAVSAGSPGIPSRVASRSSDSLAQTNLGTQTNLGSQTHGSIVGDVDRNPFTVLREYAIRTLAPVRKSVWIAGGAGIGALVVALAIVPSARSAEPDSKPVIVHTDVAGYSTPSGAANSTAPPAITPSSDSKGRSVDASVISGEDPAAAANALISARKSCFIRRIASCFGAVDQPGSAALESDLHLLHTLQRGVDLPDSASLDGWQPHLVQQLGNSAIFELRAFDGTGSMTQQGAPTPLLLVREEAGWRIRDVTLG